MAAIDRALPDSSSHMRVSSLRSRRYAMSSSGLGTVQVFGSSVIVMRFFTLSCHVILIYSFSSSEEEPFQILRFFWDRAVLQWCRGNAAVDGSTSQSPTDSCRTQRIPGDSWGFLRIPQDYTIISVILSWRRKILSSPQESSGLGQSLAEFLLNWSIVHLY